MSLWIFLIALLNSIRTILQLEKMKPTHRPGPGQRSAWAPLPQPDDYYLKDTPSNTTTTAKEARDLGTMGLQVCSRRTGSHSTQQSTVTARPQGDSPCGSAVL